MDTFSIALPCDGSKSRCSGSDAELLAAALGLPAATAELEIAGYLHRHRGSLREGIAALLYSNAAVAGVGSRRRHQLGSSLLLAQRLAEERLFERTSLQNPASCYDYLQHHYQLQHREVFTCLFLNPQRQLLVCRDLFLGTLNTAPVYPREIAYVSNHLKKCPLLVLT